MAIIFPTSRDKKKQVAQGAADGFLEAAFPKAFRLLGKISTASEMNKNRKPAKTAKPRTAPKKKNVEYLRGEFIPNGGEVVPVRNQGNRIEEPPIEAEYTVRNDDDERRKASRLLGVNLIGGGK